ncbi:MAG: hypothetical protein IJZ96_07600 [Lachnospiraceae bacterium]|nr:hypothetical protein [Lachnospiraceae bacterium]
MFNILKTHKKPKKIFVLGGCGSEKNVKCDLYKVINTIKYELQNKSVAELYANYSLRLHNAIGNNQDKEEIEFLKEIVKDTEYIIIESYMKEHGWYRNSHHNFFEWLKED